MPKINITAALMLIMLLLLFKGTQFGSLNLTFGLLHLFSAAYIFAMSK